MRDWYTVSKEEFMFDLAVDAGVDPKDAERVYQSLENFGIVDYDIEKEFLWDQYGQELEAEEDEDE